MPVPDPQHTTQGDKDPARSTYEWRPCTPPSTWADVVLFSNFSSPEYIMALRGKDICHKPGRVQGRQCSLWYMLSWNSWDKGHWFLQLWLE